MLSYFNQCKFFAESLYYEKNVQCFTGYVDIAVLKRVFCTLQDY